MSLIKAKDECRALVGNGAATAYASGVKVFEWEPINGYNRDNEMVEGLLSFVEVDDQGNRIFADKTKDYSANLLYWSSLHKDAKDNSGKIISQSNFGKTLHELFQKQFTTKVAKTLMLQALQTTFGQSLGDPSDYLELTLECVDYEGKTITGEPKTKKLMRVLNARFVTLNTSEKQSHPTANR